jgi:repressor LexA
VEELSPRQREILDFIVAQVDQTGVVPSYREIGAALGIESTNAVSDHLKALTRKGYIERVGDPGRPRSLRLTERATGMVQDDQIVVVPIKGRIAAGRPLLAVESYESSMRLDASMLPPGGKVFGLVVTGDSMIEDGIFDGDTLFVRQKDDARDGEIAVVLVDEEEATVKRFYREGDKVRLQPANSAMEPMIYDRSHQVRILGVAVGVWRKILR